jgi:hypothetical protein
MDTYVAAGLARSFRLAGGSAAVICACAPTTPGPGTATTTAAVVTTDDAVTQLARARCEREAECNLQGNRLYRHRSDCVNDYRREPAAMKLDACPHGVDKARLDMCVADLQRQRCEDDMGPVSSLPECARPACAP